MIVRDAINYAQQFVPGDSTRIPPLQLVNLAGRTLYGMHEWRFMVRPGELVNLVAGQSHIDLPLGTREVLSAVGTIESRIIDWKTPQEINELRRFQTVLGAEMWCGAVMLDSTFTPRIEVYPTPGANVTGAFSVVARMGWVQVHDDNEPLAIPDWIEPLFVELIGEVAGGVFRRSDAPLSLRLDALMATQLFQKARDQDAGFQTDLGQMTGGAYVVRETYGPIVSYPATVAP
jgi:hypothetical protein